MTLKTTLHQAASLLSPAEKRQARVLLALITMTGLMDTVGLTPVLPLLAVLGNPEIVFTNRHLHAVYVALGFGDGRHFMVFMGAVVLVAIIATNMLNAWTARRCLAFSLSVGHQLSVRMLNAYLAQPYAFFLNENPSKIMVDVVGRVYDLVHGVVSPALQLASKCVLAACIFALLLMANPALSVTIGAIVGGGYVGAYLLLRHRLRVYGNEANGANEQRGKFGNEAFNGIKEIKAAGKEAFFAARFTRASEHYTAAYVRNGFVGILPRYVLEVLAIGGMVGAILYLLLRGDNLTSILPLLGLYALAAYRLLPAVQQVFQGAALIRFSAASVNTLHETASRLRAAHTHLPPPGGEPAQPLPFTRELAFVSVGFSYPGSAAPVLRHIDFTIPKNTSLGVVGTTGAGKTTVIDLAMALLEPSSGKVLVDGQDVFDGNQRRWRAGIGYVPQTIYLADTSVASNIAFGVDDAEIDIGRLESAARMARIHDFIERELPDRYDTVVGERGVRLSGGQRQRIGIARALYHQPQFLIFDEATSALDNQTETAIVEAIQSLAHRVTMLIVAHRIGTIRDCDAIILMERGEILDRGTYADLYARNATFRALAEG
jgi:ATP-binding cassette, subfamily B, bacterial PglK